MSHAYGKIQYDQIPYISQVRQFNLNCTMLILSISLYSKVQKLNLKCTMLIMVRNIALMVFELSKCQDARALSVSLTELNRLTATSEQFGDFFLGVEIPIFSETGRGNSYIFGNWEWKFLKN